MKRYCMFFLVMMCSFIQTALSDVSFSVTFDPENYETKTVQNYHKIFPLNRHAGCLGYTDNPGYPELPVKVLRFLIPADSRVASIDIVSSTVQEIDGEFNIYPEQKPEWNGDFANFSDQQSDIYESESPYPIEPVMVVKYSHYQGNRIVTIHVSPFRYYPVKKKLAIIRNIKVNLMTGPGEKSPNAPQSKDPISYNLYFKSLRALVDNPQDVDQYAQRPVIVKQVFQQTAGSAKTAAVPDFFNYVIIAPNEFSSSFSPFVKWLKRKGMSAGVVLPDDIYSNYSGDGDSGELTDNAGKIRGYLKDGYCNYGLQYVLIGGTDTFVPVRYGKKTGMETWDYYAPADLYFGDMDGDWETNDNGDYGDYFDGVDDTADIGVGRLPFVSCTDIVNWIDKLLNYEQSPGNGDHNYLVKSYWVAADEMVVNPVTRGYVNSISILSSVLPDTTTVNEQPSGDDPDPTAPTGAEIVDGMNGKFGFINWFCHGSPDHFAVRTDLENTGDDKYGVFSYDSVVHGSYITETDNGLDNLTNENYYSIVNSMCCRVAAFDTVAHNEGFIDSNSRSMAEAFTVLAKKGGPAFIGHTRGSGMGSADDMHAGIYDKMFNHDAYRIGDAYSLAKTSEAHSNILTCNLFGDPFMPVWTGVPTTFSPTITINASSVTVDAGETGCTIAASSYDFTFAEVNDNVQSCTFTTSTRPLFIVITKQNRLPYIAVTGGTISSDQTWDEFTNITILDDITIANGATLTIAENTIVMVDPGEKIIINGTLTVNEGVSFVNIPGENVWHGIEINATGVLDVDGDITIDGALRGIHIKNINGLDNGTNVITMKHCTESGVYFSASAAVSYISCEDIDGSGSYNKAMNISSSSICPVIEHVSVSKYSHAVYMGGGAVLARYLDVANNLRSHSINQIGAYGYIDLEGPSQVGNNNIRRYSNSKAVYNYSNSTVEARNNFWGMSPPLSTIFYRPNLFNYDPWLTSAASAGAFAKIAPVVSDPDLIDIAQGLEFNGDLVNALKYYSKALESENDPAKKHYILISMLRTIDKGNRDYDGIRSLLENEIAGAKDLYLPTIEFILTDILVREGMYREAAEEFTQKAKKYADTQVGVEMFCRAAELYGDYLNDAQTALSLANRAKEINPGQQNLSIAFEAAGVSYDPNEYKNIFAPEEVTDEPAEDQHQKPSEQESVTSIAITPNPANPFTTIQYTLAKPGNVSLDVYSISGQKVATLVDGAMTSGTHSAVFDGSSLASGIYLYRFRTLGFAKTGKITLVK